jgi:hypothetical protein
MSGPADSVGHVAVVTAVNAPGGTGTITIMEQNGSYTGWDWMNVKNWTLSSGAPGSYYYFNSFQWTLQGAAPPSLIDPAPPSRIDQGAGITYSFGATGIPAPRFSLRWGTLPSGLSLTSSGLLSGMPNRSGRFVFTIAATNPSGIAVSGPLTMTVVPSVHIGGLTGSHPADLIAVNDDSTWVMPSTGTGFRAPQEWSSAPFYGTRATLVGDVSGDGRADLIAVNDDSTWVMRSTGTGFRAPQEWSTTPFYGTY